MKKYKITFSSYGYALYMKLSGIKKRTVNLGEKELNKLVAKMHTLPFIEVRDVLNSMHEQYHAQKSFSVKTETEKTKGNKKSPGKKVRTINPDIPPPKPGQKPK